MCAVCTSYEAGRNGQGGVFVQYTCNLECGMEQMTTLLARTDLIMVLMNNEG